jgi:phosphatidylinositol-3-phosphatase
MKKLAVTVAAATVLEIGAGHAGAVHANELQVPGRTFEKLDHVFLIMMENQTSTDILGNPNAPFINEYAKVRPWTTCATMSTE